MVRPATGCGRIHDDYVLMLARVWSSRLAGSEQTLTVETGHVNNVTYNRWAESSRVNWVLNFAAMDAEHKDEWKSLIQPTGIGMILRSIRTDYKFVSLFSIIRAEYTSESPGRRPVRA